MRRGSLLLTLGLFAVYTATPARAEIIEGTEAGPEAYSEVFAITHAETDPEAPELCTAVLVHPRVLLTAAHCLPEDPETPVTVREGPDARAPTATYVSVGTVRNESYLGTKDEFQRTGYDFGVVVLERDVLGADPTTGAKLARFASMERTETLAAAVRGGVVVVGYGGRNTVGTDASTGVKRWARARVGESIATTFTTSGSRGGISRGDSGGPAFLVDPATGARRLIGIASGAPADEKLVLTGLPSVSFYAAIRSKILAWAETASGYPIRSLNDKGLNP